jgi:hypothetical protein
MFNILFCTSAKFTEGHTAIIYCDVGALLAAPRFEVAGRDKLGAASSAPTKKR